MRTWLAANDVLLSWIGAVSVVTFLLSLAIVPLLIMRIPADYFVHPEPTEESFRGRHPLLRYSALALKNLLGALLLVAGLLMFVLPGQGALTMLVGMMLMSFPGKRRLELWLVRQRRIRRLLDWVRRKGGRVPLEIPATR